MSRRSLRALVVVAHPCPDSLIHAAAAAAVRGLEQGGHQVKLIDLYAEGFRPAMSTEERLAYHSDAPLLDPVAAAHAELVCWADTIVVAYPTWWSGMPAILKGWFERVFVTGVAFGFDDSGKICPTLTELRHIVGISTYGSPKLYVNLVNDNGRRIVMRALRMSCGARLGVARRWFGLYAVDTSTEAQRRAFLERIESSMATLDAPRRPRLPARVRRRAATVDPGGSAT